MNKNYLIILLALLPVFAAAQISNLRSKAIPVLGIPQKIDSLTVIPNSVQVLDPSTGSVIDPKHYSIEHNAIAFDSTINSKQSTLNIKYRVFPFDLSAPYARLDSSFFDKQIGDRLIGVPYDPYAGQGQPLLPQTGLDYNGSYTRGLSFGNNQSLVLNSQFNLQMAGTLGDLEVLAAITDNSIPLQPEGNTQQLREFDKIFIQISKNENKLIAGDYELSKPDGYFMNYFKKLQGATFSLSSPLPTSSASWQRGVNSLPFGEGRGGAGGWEGAFSIGSARGKFARNTLVAQEGNQGPYRLEGSEGERFIIVLSGTEKVVVDGQLMTRGLDADYVIDYNAGHITFTNRRLITKDSRIVVEFDYNVQDYQRSLYAFNTKMQKGDWKFYLNTYSEQDGKQPIDDDFSQMELEALQLAGDEDVILNSIDSVEEFSAFRVLYALLDTTVAGTLYEDVLVFSNDPERALYTATFSQVGAGNGHYIQDTETPANGRVFRWVAPDPITGLPSGNYEPVRRIVAPNRLQLYTAGAAFDPTKNTSIRAEIALSSFNKNRLSTLNNSDNAGLAGTLGLRHNILFEKNTDPTQNSKLNNSKLAWHLELTADYEFTQQRFKELNPYRPSEFTRDWNVNNGVNDVGIVERESDEHLVSTGFELKSPKAGSLQYQFGGFFRDSIYEGVKHFGKYAYQKNGYDIWLQGDFLNTDKSTSTSGERSDFFRPKFNITVPVFRDSTGQKFWRTGVYGERERNSRFTKITSGTDTLNMASFYYDVLKLSFESPEYDGFGLGTSYKRRIDHAPDGSEFSTTTIADELNLQGNWQQSRNSRVSWNFTYRKLAIENDELTNLDPSESYLGRLDYTLNILRGVVQSNTSYEIGSGQERKIEITYLQVQAGEGTHLWTDRNGDGQVQVNEVEIAPFQDQANAVRVNTYTDDFIRTNNVTFNQSLRLEPKAIWFNQTGVRKFLARFSTQSSLQITRKVLDLEEVNQWNPFQLDVADTALVSSRSGVYNNLFFNRADPKFDLQIGMSDNQNKYVQTTGFESRRQQQQFLKSRWNMTRSLSLQASLTLGIDEQGSEQFENRRYLIRSLETKPQLTYQPTNNFRTALTWSFKTAENELGSAGENATTNDIKLESVFNQSSATSIRSEFSLVNIQYEGEANSPVGFAFLKGLQNGKNYLWNITLDRQIAKNIRMGITYEGRKTGQANVVHVGRAQVGAVF